MLNVPTVFETFIDRTLMQCYGEQTIKANPQLRDDLLSMILLRGVKAHLLASGFAERSVDGVIEKMKNGGEAHSGDLMEKIHPGMVNL